MSTEKTPTAPIESEPDYRARRGLVAAGLAGAVALAGYGAHEGIQAVDKGFRYHQVGSPVTEGINGGGIQTVQEGANELAKQNHVSPTDIGNIVSAGQNVEDELKRKYGEVFLQPGQPIQVTLEKSTFGGYKVEAHVTDENSAE